MQRTIIAYLFALIASCSLWANDGVYFTSGNFLVPTRETDISVVKKVLTITIGKDSMARVDVCYELMNNSQPKTVTMAFEVEASHNVGDPVNRKGIHPFIKDYTVVMNGQRLPNRNGDGFVVTDGETEPRRIKVRKRPNEKSKMIATIPYRPGEILEVFPCLGFTSEDGDGSWFKIKVGDKLGYVAEPFMRWDSVNAF